MSTTTEVYHDGLTHGTLVTLELLLGTNTSRLLPDELFEEARYKGALGGEVHSYLTRAQVRARADAIERGVVAR